MKIYSFVKYSYIQCNLLPILGAHNVPDLQKESIVLFSSASKIIIICQNQQSIP